MNKQIICNTRGPVSILDIYTLFIPDRGGKNQLLKNKRRPLTFSNLVGCLPGDTSALTFPYLHISSYLFPEWYICNEDTF